MLIFSFNDCKAQSVKGNWYGVGHIQMDGNSENYLSEIILKEDGNQIKGEFNYYFRDSLFKNKVKCSFNKKTRILIIHKFPIIYFKSRSTKQAVMCEVMGIFELRVAKTESVLNGSITSASDANFLMPVINYRMQKENTAKAKNQKNINLEDPESENPILEASNTPTPVSVPVKKEISKPITIDSNHTNNLNDKKVVPINVLTEKEFSNRKKDYAKILVVDNPVLQIEVYDNGSIDFDSVSLLLNGKLILPKSMLTHHSIKLKIELNENLEYNELGMFAENLGLIPPNTAALIIRDGIKKYEYILNSDFDKSAVIRLKRNR